MNLQPEVKQAELEEGLKRSRRRQWQVPLLIVVLALVAILTIRTYLRRQRTVEFSFEGTSGCQAQIFYGKDTSQHLVVDLPWKTQMKIWGTEGLSASVANFGSCKWVKCQIRVDGKTWRTDESLFTSPPKTGTAPPAAYCH